MIKISTKIILLTIIVILINNAVFRVFHLPFFWGNTTAKVKTEYLIEHQDNFNTVFFGTSKFYWQINTALFDSLTGYKTKSFNYGIDGIKEPEVFYYIDNILAKDSNIKNIFIESFDIGISPEISNLNTLRLKYCFDTKSWMFTTKAIISSSYNITDKIYSLFFYTVNYLEWLSKFDMLKDVMKEGTYSINKLDYLGAENNGFVSIEKRAPQKQSAIDSTLPFRIKQANLELFKAPLSIPDNESYFKSMKEEIIKIQHKNINVFLVLEPRCNETQLANIVPCFIKLDLPRLIKFNLADAKIHPEFYDSVNIFDAYHLNSNGGILNTQELADSFNAYNIKK